MTFVQELNFLGGNFINGEKTHIAYGYCDGTKIYERLTRENVDCRNFLSEFYCIEKT
jgi:hypothetical protein